MARHAFLAGYHVYIACMMALWFLVLFPVFRSLMDKLSWISILIAFTFPLAMKNFRWVASKVIAILLCITCYLVSTLIGLVVLKVGIFICTSAMGKPCDEAFVVIACVTFVVMHMILSYSNKLVNDMHGVTVLVERPSFTSQLFSNLPFSIKSTHLDPTGYLMGMLATLLALLALMFLVTKGLSLLTILLPLDTYPRLRFATIVGLTFMVMRYMVDKSALFSGMKATLLGLLNLKHDYQVTYLVVRYLAFLALTLLPQVTTCGDYYMADIIISVGVLLTMRPGPRTPIKDPALIAVSSTGSLDHFIRFSWEMMVGHKMATEKIISKFNIRGEIQSFIVHTVLIPMTTLCATLFYVLSK